MVARLIIIIILFACEAALAQKYLWPTDASDHLTSSFSEPRPRRFHAGLDIKTWGKSGFKVFAARDGYVTRMRVSPYGYGRALYILLDTGETAVYAHLQKFNHKFQAIAEREQEQKKLFRIDKYFKANALPVEGEEILMRDVKSKRAHRSPLL